MRFTADGLAGVAMDMGAQSLPPITHLTLTGVHLFTPPATGVTRIQVTDTVVMEWVAMAAMGHPRTDIRATATEEFRSGLGRG